MLLDTCAADRLSTSLRSEVKGKVLVSCVHNEKMLYLLEQREPNKLYLHSFSCFFSDDALSGEKEVEHTAVLCVFLGPNNKVEEIKETSQTPTVMTISALNDNICLWINGMLFSRYSSHSRNR